MDIFLYLYCLDFRVQICFGNYVDVKCVLFALVHEFERHD